MHKVFTSQFATRLSGSYLDFLSWNLQINLTRALRRGAFQPRVIGITQLQTTMARLTSCILHCAVILQIQALKRSQISILVVNRPLKPLGRYLTPGEPNHTLNHSCCVVPHEYFISWGIYGKTSRICFLQSSSFRMPSTLSMLHSFHYWIAIGFGARTIIIHAFRFRFSSYDFTTLCTLSIYR